MKYKKEYVYFIYIKMKPTQHEFTHTDTFTADNERSYKVLAIGDPHFRIDNLEDVASYIVAIGTVLEREKPDSVIILGDLLHYHERIHTTVLNTAYTFIHTIRKYCPVYVIVGNHDYINNSQFLSSNHWMNAMKEWAGVHIVDNGLSISTPQGKLVCCPYVAPGRFNEALEHIDTEWKDARIIFCHQEFRGCKMGAVESTDGDEWELAYPLVVAGHIHDKQRPQANIFYSGSSLQHAFGESHDKTITACVLHDNQIEINSIDLGLPHKQILYLNLDQVQEFSPDLTSKDKLRVTLSGTYEEFKVFRKSTKYKELLGKNIKVVYRPTSEIVQCERSSGNDFYTILLQLLDKENNKRLIELYHEIIPK